ncbi:Uncharacterized protein APZ42_001140, partial [Daphnia magna]
PFSLRKETLDGVHDGHFGESKCVLRQGHLCIGRGVLFAASGLIQQVALCRSMKSTTSAALIGEVTRFFCDFGRPEVLESDNGTQFSSAEFREFCRTMGVQQVSSSPEFSQSNGLVERHVQTVKRTLLKMFADGKSLWDSLAAIRSTPVSSSLPAPSVLLQGRNLRGNLPFLPAELQPKYISSSVVRRELSARQSQAAFVQAGVPNARASSLHIGQPVRALIGRRW